MPAAACIIPFRQHYLAASNHKNEERIMKNSRIGMAGTMVATLILSACNTDSLQRDATISLSFAAPLKAVVTKSEASADTNDFHLRICNVNGETVYDGRYGDKPQTFTVRAGSYEVSAVSTAFDAPAFEMPQYGDSQIVVVADGERADIRLACHLCNAGICFIRNESFVKRYPSGKLVVEQDAGALEYGPGESRTGFFLPGDVTVSWRAGSGPDTLLFSRRISSGEIHSLRLNASSEYSVSGISMTLDTNVFRICEDITLGDSFAGEDGRTASTAWSVSSARPHEGDTAWVWGYIVGGDLTSSSVSFEGPFTRNSNMAIAATHSTRSRDDCFSVELSKAAIRSALNLVDNPGNLGRKVILRGVISKYYNLTGLKSVSDYLLP